MNNLYKKKVIGPFKRSFLKCLILFVIASIIESKHNIKFCQFWLGGTLVTIGYYYYRIYTSKPVVAKFDKNSEANTYSIKSDDGIEIILPINHEKLTEENGEIILKLGVVCSRK
ncbi:hypothetical protein AAEX28_15465 [Lentisphaerota bacterium WC36G]|nr:hypothetical protein LJT99_02220 [Lentisphaerae bacterium WC36]